jgi:hypothetical protein
LVVAAVLALACGFAEIAHAQNGVNPLNLFKNYFVTGDYVVGGVGLRGLGVNGWATGTISIPDGVQSTATGTPSSSVPPGAEVVAAFLYWQTIEKTNLVFAGQNGFFNGYAIAGKVLGAPNTSVAWSSKGCSGDPEGKKVLRTYRADVRPFLPLDVKGKVLPNGNFQVKLADSGDKGDGPPMTLGATLVIIYRLLASSTPMNSIILYDGAYSPLNDDQATSQAIVGFYQASAGPIAKLTAIVGDGRPRKFETVELNSVVLPSLYGAHPPFPGVYNKSWDNPTWIANKYGAAVNANDSTATAQVRPLVPEDDEDGKGCVTWGATIFSTTVPDSDGDGLLDVWKAKQGYTDVNTGDWVALPNATPGVKDIFIQLDYLNALSSGSPHSHLPQRATLDAVGSAYATHGINLHFDIGPTPGPAFVGDAYMIPYPLPVGPGATPPPAGTGGHGIPESTIVCNGALCEFPGQAAISWKTGFENVKAQNFWPGRKDSYRYILFGHSLGMPTSTWSATGEVIPNALNGTLVSIVNVGTTATVTIQTPIETPPFPIPSNLTPVTVSGAINQFALNGTYAYGSLVSQTSTALVTTTSFTITTSGVANGTYNFSNEPQLALAIGGPNSTSGFSDYGGADTLITLGLWPNFDPANCQHDPSQPPLAGGYCADQVGTVGVQTGTLFHEMGHPLTLTHGGTYYPSGSVGPAGQQINSPIGLPAFGENCKSNFLSAMNYLFQIFGFPDGGQIDYSGQTLQDLSENSLNETTGLGKDLFGTHQPAAHFTRWYAPPNAADMAIQALTHKHYAGAHCDGSPITDGANMVKMKGSTFSSPIDWNNDGAIEAATFGPQDINFNGTVGDPAFHGFNDWVNLNLTQIGARRNVGGFSGGVTGADIFGGGADIFGGGADIFGGGADIFGGGADIFGGGADIFGGGAGFEIDFTIASATVDPPSGLTCTDCVSVSGVLTETTVTNPNPIRVPLSWTPPGFGVLTNFTVWRATGSFPTAASVAAALAANSHSFQSIGTVSGTPPAITFIDATAVNGQTYTYFITDTNSAAVQSGPSDPLVVTIAVPPSGLQCTNCFTPEGGVLTEQGQSVPLTWTAASPSLANQFTVWRAPGTQTVTSFNPANPSPFVNVGTTPSAAFTDSHFPNAGIYTYIVTDFLTPTAVQTGPSNALVVNVLCDGDGDGDHICNDPDDGLLSVFSRPSLLGGGLQVGGLIYANESVRKSNGLDLRP